ncbi:MAG: efflux RND transporter periplasmic adaptor subunit [Bacteroidetes bacterium]|nr:MAG: efflux RND transporter periplasmic adaptor subunit [Bacteroidota bacterium]
MFSRLFTFSFSLALVSCTSSGYPPEEKLSSDTLLLSEAQERGAQLEWQALRLDTVWEEVRLVGRTVILAHAQAQVHSRVPGFIEGIFVREGQYVQAGQVLFRLYSSQVVDLERQYGEARQRYLAAMRRAAQQESLRASQLTSLAEVATAQAELRQAQSQLQAIETQLRLVGVQPDTLGRLPEVVLRAPISGYVTQVTASMGQYILPEQPLAHIANPHDLHADLYISERELGWIKPGLEVRLRFPAIPEISPLSTRVEYVAQMQDSAGTHLIVHVRIPHTQYPLFAGIPIEGYIRRPLGRGFLVPSEALGYRGREAYVFVRAAGGGWVPVPVRELRRDSLVWIAADALKEGWVIAWRGAAFLASQLWQVGQE